jgi:hypothetical protein
MHVASNNASYGHFADTSQQLQVRHAACSQSEAKQSAVGAAVLGSAASTSGVEVLKIPLEKYAAVASLRSGGHEQSQPGLNPAASALLTLAELREVCNLWIGDVCVARHGDQLYCTQACSPQLLRMRTLPTQLDCCFQLC